MAQKLLVKCCGEIDYRRWFKQATADLSAAQEGLSKFSQQNEWICLMAQHTAEKALKSLLFMVQVDKLDDLFRQC